MKAADIYSPPTPSAPPSYEDSQNESVGRAMNKKLLMNVKHVVVSDNFNVEFSNQKKVPLSVSNGLLKVISGVRVLVNDDTLNISGSRQQCRHTPHVGATVQVSTNGQTTQNFTLSGLQSFNFSMHSTHTIQTSNNQSTQSLSNSVSFAGTSVQKCTRDACGETDIWVDLPGIESIRNAGTGVVRAILNHKEITLNNDGPGRIAVSGTAERVRINNRGNGVIDLTKLHVDFLATDSPDNTKNVIIEAL